MWKYVATSTQAHAEHTYTLKRYTYKLSKHTHTHSGIFMWVFTCVYVGGVYKGGIGGAVGGSAGGGHCKQIHIPAALRIERSFIRAKMATVPPPLCCHPPLLPPALSLPPSPQSIFSSLSSPNVFQYLRVPDFLSQCFRIKVMNTNIISHSFWRVFFLCGLLHFSCYTRVVIVYFMTHF